MSDKDDDITLVGNDRAPEGADGQDPKDAVIYEEYTEDDLTEGSQDDSDAYDYDGDEEPDDGLADDGEPAEDEDGEVSDAEHDDDEDDGPDDADMQDRAVYAEYTEEDFSDGSVPLGGEGWKEDLNMAEGSDKNNKKLPTGLVVLYSLVAIVVALSIWVAGTESGRNFAFGVVAGYVYDRVSNSKHDYSDSALVPVAKQPEAQLSEAELDEIPVDERTSIGFSTPTPTPFVPRTEDYVKTYLLFGIEEIEGNANTDAMILLSINQRDKTLKLTSINRDTYVSCPGYYNNKLNSVYARAARKYSDSHEAKDAGGHLLISVIENTFDIGIEGYACVNFNAFKAIIDRLGGVDIELGTEEAEYLNKTNYIDDPVYRNVKPGMNHLNGSQALGYCRIRKVKTIEGVKYDDGRTLRQRKVLKAIVNAYKSAGIFEMMDIMSDCLGYVYTDLSREQMSEMLQNVITNKIFTVQDLKIPVNGGYVDSGKEGIYNGNRNITYTLVMDGKEKKNIDALHQFVFLDPVVKKDVVK